MCNVGLVKGIRRFLFQDSIIIIMKTIYFIKAEAYKIIKSKGYFFAIPLLVLPLFSFLSVLSGTEGLVSLNSSLIEWNIVTTFTNVTFYTTQVVYFIFIYKYYLSEIDSGYFKNISLFNGGYNYRVKGKNHGISFFLLIIYIAQILFSTLLYYLLLISKRVEFSGYIFSSEYNIYALAFIITQGIIFCLAYPRFMISITILFQRQSPILILLFTIFIERVFENWNIISYMLPWNIILNYFLRLGNDCNNNIIVNSVNMVTYSILYVVILEIINRSIVLFKRDL